MIRILPGDSWKLNPSYLASLKQLDERAARRFSPVAIHDVLGIEVDGVNLAQGLHEAAIFPLVQGLAELVLRLCQEPEGRGQVLLGEGRTELVLGRRGASAALCVVSLSRPARLLAGELEVDLAALALATASCAHTLLADLTSINPSLCATPFARRLARQSSALRKAARLASGAGSEPAKARLGTPDRAVEEGSVALAFALRDETGRIDSCRDGADLYSLLSPGELFLRDAAGAEISLASGAPFLLLSDAPRAAAELVEAAEAREKTWELSLGGQPCGRIDLRAETLRVGERALRCRPHALARALLEGAIDFAAALVARNPAQAQNAYLSNLSEEASDRLAHLRDVEGGDLYDNRSKPLPAPARATPEAPLSAGKLKRLRFRPAWTGADTGERALSISLRRGVLLAVGRRRATWLDSKTGKLIAQQTGESIEPWDDGALVADRSRLKRFGARGRPVFVREQPGHDQPALTSSSGRFSAGPMRQTAMLCVFDGSLVAAVYAATGRTAWQFRIPQAFRIATNTADDRAFVAADNGFLYALDVVAGQVVFRVRSGCAFEGPLAVGSRIVASLGRTDGALWLAAIDALSGRSHVARPVQMQSAGAPVLLRRQILVGGTSEAVSTVAAYTAGGRELFRTSLEARGGIPALVVYQSRIYCTLRDGSVTCLDSRGKRIWAAPPAGIELDRALPAVIRRHVLIAPGDPIRALDPADGRVLCDLPPTLGLSAMAVSRKLDVFAIDDDGVAGCFKLATHLSVV
ncbi:MAG: PQQ-binding-like beta-propeller repeat protein [Myxococcales bacterium]|jgi:outer membrane protein assembly factor BamB